MNRRQFLASTAALALGAGLPSLGQAAGGQIALASACNLPAGGDRLTASLEMFNRVLRHAAANGATTVIFPALALGGSLSKQWYATIRPDVYNRALMLVAQMAASYRVTLIFGGVAYGNGIFQVAYKATPSGTLSAVRHHAGAAYPPFTAAAMNPVAPVEIGGQVADILFSSELTTAPGTAHAPLLVTLAAWPLTGDSAQFDRMLARSQQYPLGVLINQQTDQGQCNAMIVQNGRASLVPIPENKILLLPQ